MVLRAIYTGQQDWELNNAGDKLVPLAIDTEVTKPVFEHRFRESVPVPEGQQEWEINAASEGLVGLALDTEVIGNAKVHRFRDQDCEDMYAFRKAGAGLIPLEFDTEVTINVSPPSSSTGWGTLSADRICHPLFNIFLVCARFSCRVHVLLSNLTLFLVFGESWTGSIASVS
jgi:hypothetical protein